MARTDYAMRECEIPEGPGALGRALARRAGLTDGGGAAQGARAAAEAVSA